MRYLIILFGLLLPYITVGQDDMSIVLMDTDDSWRKEAFHFPKPFAPEVDFEGIADVRFTHGWSDMESAYFWSYAFSWKIDLTNDLSDSELETYLQYYFDGLMKVVNTDKEKIIPVTNALISSTPIDRTSSTYKGKIKLYDAFFSKDMITLHVNGSHRYCRQSDKHVFIFRLSPQSVGSPEWVHINKAVLVENICDH